MNQVYYLILIWVFLITDLSYSQSNAVIKKPNLYIITLGINRYKDKYMNLRYCVNDSKEIGKVFSENSKFIFNEVFVRSLSDKMVIRKNVEDEINQVAKNSKPEDTFIFSFSGIGATEGSKFGIFFYDDVITSTDSGNIGNELLSSWMSKINAKNKLIIFDCCSKFSFQQSFFRNLFKPKQNLLKLLGENYLQIGVDGVALEYLNLEHGFLTYKLLNAMNGEADFNNDKFITSNELRWYFDLNNVSDSMKSVEYDTHLTLGFGEFKLGFKGDSLEFNNAEDLKRGIMPEFETNLNTNNINDQESKNYALMIATNDYQKGWSSLKNPILDAEVISKDLKEIYDFDTIILRNQSNDVIYSILTEYALKSYKKNDKLLIFFSGHGNFIDNLDKGCIITNESITPAKDPYGKSTIPFEDIKNLIDRIPCDHIFLIVDVCFGGAFNREIMKTKNITKGANDVIDQYSREKLLERAAKYKTRLCLTSGMLEPVSDGISGQHSPFTRKFLEALRSKGEIDMILTSSEVKSYVENLVQSQPLLFEFGSNEPGSDFLFVSK